MDLKNLVSSCGYHVEEKSKVLRDQIVMGLVSNVVREKLLDHAALTLNTAVDRCRSSEVTGQLLMGMSATNESLPVHAVKQKGQGRRSTHTNTYCITPIFRVEESYAIFANLDFARNFPPAKIISTANGISRNFPPAKIKF